MTGGRYGFVCAEPGDDEQDRQDVSAGYPGRLVAESIRPGDLALIAAAPDLLAACEAMLAATDGYPLPPEALAGIVKMRAAAKKAVGQ
jgi:hypothetical protein